MPAQELEKNNECPAPMENYEMNYEYNGRHYELLYANNYFDPNVLYSDINFWINMAEQYGDPILELCCGTGRVSSVLAENGWQVTGIDISDSMLLEAKRKSSQVEWIKANIQNFHLDKKFSLIIVPFDSLGYLLELEAIEGCLSCVRKHLKPDGRMIIGLANYCSQENLEFYLDKSEILFSEYTDPDGKGLIKVTWQNEFDFSTQINKEKLLFRFIEQEKEVIQEGQYRLYFPQELEALLKYNGFVVESKLGNYNKEPFTAESPNHILISKLHN